MKNRITRRTFLGGVAGAVGASMVGPYILRAAEVNVEKLRFAHVGTGGQAGSHLHLIDPEKDNQHCAAYCDVDSSRMKEAARLAPYAPGYSDYRKMLEKHEKEIDAVVIAIPDHSHAAASMMAMNMRKHVYTEKPLTWSVSEARLLAETAAKYKLATQMGNMGHANEGNRLVVEWVRGGALGDITEVHTWTNRPVWPQGIAKRPPTKPVPANLDWDCWIGPAPYRDFHDSLHPFNWRGWFDFGCGAVGDMGCHTWDCVYWSMQPDYPQTAELVKIVNRCDETYPSQAIIKWTFPAKGSRPPFVAFWYEHGLKPPVPDEILNDPTRQGKRDRNGNVMKPDLPQTGSLFIGTKGKLLVAGDYAESPRLIPESFMQQVGKPKQLLERSPGHKQEWVAACRGEKPWDSPGSNFATYAGPLTEVMLLGAMAIRLGQPDFKIECDPVNRIIKTPEAIALSSRVYRDGWKL